jgi:signal transduction histidine kinase/CheY-like chemotaxis protein
MGTTLASIAIRRAEDVVEARRQARELAARLGFDANDRARLAAAVTEVAWHVLQNANGGAMDFSVHVERDGRGTLEARISDTGAGIEPMKIPEGAPGLTAQRLHRMAAEIAKPAARATMVEDLRNESRELLCAMDELRARQEEVARLHAELEDTNRGLTALYAELDEKAERSRRAEQMNSLFVRHLSHEFRTPLASILALSRLLRDGVDGQLGAEQQKQVTFIRKSAEILVELGNDLLELARVDEGKPAVRPTKFQVSSLMGALRVVLRPLHVREAVELVFEDASGMPPMNTDASKVAQILRNFVSNALRFTERGEVRVTTRLSPDGRSAIFEVSDTGIGISPENADAIFQEFGQVDGAMPREFRGSGLGLPLSKGLAELLGGRVWVGNATGRGSIFHAQIPLTYTGMETAPAGGQAAPQPACDVVVIDDEEVSRYLIRQMLGPGIVLLEATDGRSGIEMARQQNPRGILLDLRIPGMSGFEVLRQLKADSATRDIPVVIVTSKMLTAEERDIVNSQASAVLSKELLAQPDCGDRIRHAIGYPS